MYYSKSHYLHFFEEKMIPYPRVCHIKMFSFFVSLTLFVLFTTFTLDVDLSAVTYYYDRWYGDISCHYQNIQNGIKDTDEDENFQPEDSKSIFFHETSCKSVNGNVVLSARQACAIESAAIMNPEFKVYLLFSSPIVLNRGEELDQRLLKKLLSYTNVRISRINISKYVKGTPLHAWLYSGALNKSSYRTSHTSDVLRYLSLWKYGGIYLDLDVIVVKKLMDLDMNYAGMENLINIGAGVIGISHDERGRPFADATLREIATHFRGDLWGHNGPGVITRVLRHTCKVQNLSAMTTERCEGFTVHPTSTFYPISADFWYWYFQPKKLKEVLHLIKDSYVVHVWNKLSSVRRTRPDVTVAYTHLAKIYCPKVYEEAKDNF